jgi:hypothetical protein
MVRRKYSRRKRRTNWLVLSYVARSWVLNYLKARQFERFYSALGRFNVSAYTSSACVFHMRLPHLHNTNGVNILSCSSNILAKHTNYSSGAKFLLNCTQGTNNELLQTLDMPSMSASVEAYPNVVVYDNVLYSYDDLLLLEELRHSALPSTTNVLTDPILSWVVASRQVLTLLTLLRAAG